EAAEAVKTMTGHGDAKNRDLVRHGFVELLRFAEHDFGGTDRERAALSAGTRADAVTQAADIARSLLPEPVERTGHAGDGVREEPTFDWRGGRVVFDPNRCSVASIADASGQSWISSGFGEFVHTRYRGQAKADSVFPEALPSSPAIMLRDLRCRRTDRGVRITADFDRCGFEVHSEWVFHEAHPWIDVCYRLRGGWTDDPQTVEFRFPFAMDKPAYRYDTPGAIVAAGPKQSGGDDLPGANPELYAGVTFAAASTEGRTALVFAPDSLLWRFGRENACVTSMPMMNLTRNDHQFGQAGRREWTFRYRVVLLDKPFDPLAAVQEAQQFEVPPFLLVPGQSPAVSGLTALEIDFAGGPLLAFKVAEDNSRLILRFWNVLDRETRGSFQVPPGWSKPEVCDALERPEKSLDAAEDRVIFDVGSHGIATIALSPAASQPR
ncbi:MAG: glycosyl hydrolase-related protein, partial [Phycisphaerales bacterium]